MTLKRLLLGAGVVTGTHTGYTIEVTCGSTTVTIVSPTSPAAAGQDINGTGVYVLAVGAYLRPNQFPAGKVMLCACARRAIAGPPPSSAPAHPARG